MKKNPIETILGVFVIVVAVWFAVYAAGKIDARPKTGYALSAVFTKSGGIQSGNDVRINGIKVGTVTDVELTPEYTAKVTIGIRDGVAIPADSVAEIASDGLMGDPIVRIEPGKAPDKFKDGDVFAKTKDFRSMEDIIGDVIFSVTDKKE